jgi:magnesium transporter
VLPVLDDLGKLVGRKTIDDVVDVIREEAAEDIQMMAGISEKVESSDKVWILSRARLPWLMVGFVGEIINSRLIGSYEWQLHIHPEMAFFMPLIAAMGGNVGVQSSSIIVQGLANNSFSLDSIFSKLLKEFNVGLINGLVCSLLILGFNLLLNVPVSLSLTVSVSLLSVILFASIFGTAVPMILKKLNFDPALATGPFITTVNDILAMFLYFTIGMLMY